jgi:hypothetical protein
MPKYLAEANILAYFITASVAKTSRLITLTPGENVIKIPQ